MVPNRGVIAAACLVGVALAVAFPGAGLEAAGAGSEAEPCAATSPAQTGRFIHVECGAAVAARGQSRIRHVHND